MRLDFAIGEDTDFIVVADAALQNVLTTRKQIIAASLQDDAFVIPLPEDGGLAIRLVAGDLTEDEQMNWVAKAERPLQVTSQQLVVDAGGFFGQETAVNSINPVNFQSFDLKPGHYWITCLVYFTSNIATDLFKRHKFSYLELFKNSNPGCKVPVWLIDEAECRCNETDEQLIETIDEDEIDYDTDNQFVDVVLLVELMNKEPESKESVNSESLSSELPPVDSSFSAPGVSSVVPSELSKTGRLKWTKRVPKVFPKPLPGTVAKSTNTISEISTRVANDFRRGEFDAFKALFTEELRTDLDLFLSDLLSQITEKMKFPSRRFRSESDLDLDRWLAIAERPRCKVDLKGLETMEFVGSSCDEFVVGSDNQQRQSVTIQLGFVRNKDEIQVAGIRIDWKVPVQRKRRRPLVLAGPPCPACGERLASDKANQCIHCGTSWR